MACTSDNPNSALYSRLTDLVSLCDKRGSPCYLGFLDAGELTIARELLRSLVAMERYAVWGGFPEAERSVISVFPDYYAPDEWEYPIVPVAFRYRMQRKLTHRDVLGTLMHLGLRRDTIGDILCGEGLSVVFLRKEIAPFVCEQIDKIGGEGVSVIDDYDGPLPISVSYEVIHETVASPRLDSIVKALIRCSREKSADLITVGSVSVDHRPVESVSKFIQTGMTVSIRGYGRFLIDQIGPETKKGRLTLLARRRL